MEQSQEEKGRVQSTLFQLILLDNIVIGATNPQTLAYPAANYNLVNNEIPFTKRVDLEIQFTF